MITIRQLAELTLGLDAEAFEVRLGPFALVQRPDSESLKERGPESKVERTQPIPGVSFGAPANMSFGELQVATLPTAAPLGLVSLVIGRAPACELVVDDPAVSSLHAVINWNGTVGVLSELGSTNGTFVNGQKITGDQPLDSGDLLSFGQSHFIYYLADALRSRLSSL